MATRSALQEDWTVARLHALPDDGKRYEIIDGVLYVTPAPRYVHQWAVQTLYDLLHPYATRSGLQLMCLAADIQYSERTLVQPDLFCFARAAERQIRDWADVQPLVLAVEILSRSTRVRDRTVKRELYQAQGVAEYWIVDPETRAIERWTPGAKEADMLIDALSWQPVPAYDALVIDVPAYFRTVLDN